MRDERPPAKGRANRRGRPRRLIVSGAIGLIGMCLLAFVVPVPMGRAAAFRPGPGRSGPPSVLPYEDAAFYGPSGAGFRLVDSAGGPYGFGAPGAPVGPASVTVDATVVRGPGSRVGQGFLHSAYPIGQEPQLLAALDPNAWRTSVYGPATDPYNLARWAVGAPDGAATTALISDMWYTDTHSGGVAPWADWPVYQAWVEARVKAIEAAGYQVSYWEVYNEPDRLAGYYTPAVYATVTPQLLLQQFLVTYQAIKAADPAAQVIGPSLADFYTPTTARTFSMADFLSFAAANHITLAALSWHYNTGDPQQLVGQVAEARNQIAAQPGLGSPKIFIDEYGSPGLQQIPGWDVAYLSALNQAGVDQAERSCWDGDCTAPTLDGLLAAGGTGALPDYWVRQAYGQMTGDQVASSTSEPDVSAVAYLDPAADRVSVLVGRGDGCAQDPRCLPAIPDRPPVPVDVGVRVPWSSGTVSVSISRIPGGTVSPTPQPPATITDVAVTPAAGGGTISVPLLSFGDGAAAAITVTLDR